MEMTLTGESLSVPSLRSLLGWFALTLSRNLPLSSANPNQLSIQPKFHTYIFLAQ